MDAAPTLLLQALSRGERGAADRLLPLVYEELRAVAASLLRRERADAAVQATDLAHRAWLRLVDQDRVDWKGRAHFFAVAAEAIRRLLIDQARRRAATRRGGDAWRRVTLAEDVALDGGRSLDVLALEEALDRLAALDERQARVVRLRFYGGLSVDEVAACLEVSPRTVAEDWRMARAWLHRELQR
jgi:RNA polymerase sigma factor (TIGR02999 family)